MSAARDFPIGDVLSVTTGRLLSRRHMAGVYDVLGHVTGDPGITTIGIAMVSGAAAAHVLAQHPDLEGINNELWALETLGKLPDGWPAWMEWVDGAGARHGWSLQASRWRSIEPMSPPLHVPIGVQLAYVRSINPTCDLVVVSPAVQS